MCTKLFVSRRDSLQEDSAGPPVRKAPEPVHAEEKKEGKKRRKKSKEKGVIFDLSGPKIKDQSKFRDQRSRGQASEEVAAAVLLLRPQ